MSRSVLLVACLSLLLAAVLATSSSARTESRGCGSLRVGLAYANNIRATNMRCNGRAGGRDVAHGYTSCRNRHAGRSACHRVGRFGCREGRRHYGAGEFYSNVTCSRGSRRVSFVSSRI